MAERKKNTGLGKGLDALFGELGIGTEEKPSDNTAAAGGAEEISIDDIKPTLSLMQVSREKSLTRRLSMNWRAR